MEALIGSDTTDSQQQERLNKAGEVPESVPEVYEEGWPGMRCR
jgi:hypothetical protein